MGLTPGPVDEPPVLYFRVADVAAYTTRVRELGGEVVSEATYDSGPNAVCRDDQGREFQLWSPAPGYE
jgi:predicted enzyme related to lactoylglutathione lyase